MFLTIARSSGLKKWPFEEFVIDPARKLLQACRLLVKNQEAITEPDPAKVGETVISEFAEAWLDMKEAVKEMEKKRCKVT